MSTPARRSRSPRRPTETAAPPALGSPVEVRIIGHDADVRRLVEAFVTSAAGAAGPVSYRPARSGGTRAYLAVTVPSEE